MISIPQGIHLSLKLITQEIKYLKQKHLVIALDGHSSSGKSTLSKDLSKILEIPHIDTGAMYRSVTLYLLKHDVEISNIDDVIKALNSIEIAFEIKEGLSITKLNGINVEEEIRSMQVSKNVSKVAAISEVRKMLVTQQRNMAQSSDVIMDGRDIGTVVLPAANAKLFVTASVEVRAQRRYKELVGKGHDVTLSQVRDNLRERDQIDSNRADSPLRQASDAILLDTSDLDRGGMLAQAIKIIHRRSKETVQ